jgi:dTDP-4-amino-4,6-dideoxygalactose transaminase
VIVPHSRPTIDQEDVKAVSEVLASGKIAQGEKVEEFEKAVASFVGAKYGVAVSSGTAALHLALLSLGVGHGDEVIIPSFVCSSLYFAVMHAGAKPKIVDIDLEDLNISASAVEKAVSSKTKTIIVPHMFGTPAEIDEFLKFGVPVIEDCAQSVGAEYRGRQVGGFGELSVFSFYATKMITTGEGGMVLTNSSDFYGRIVDVRDYDKKPLAPVKYNYKMTDFQAGLGLSQLRKLPHFIERRRQIASQFFERFQRYNVELLRVPSHKKSVFYRFVVMVNDVGRIQEMVKSKGIMCERSVFRPLHEGLCGLKCPNSDTAYSRALSVPIYPSLSANEIKYMFQVFDDTFAEVS